MNGLALCTGIGGIELGLSIAVPRYRSVCYVEREAYCASLLVARMAEAALDVAPIWCDLATFNGRPWRGLVDIISAGLPCQPYSVAGKQLGWNDPRCHDVVPHALRIIEEVQPSMVFLENVPTWITGGYFRPVGDRLSELGYAIEAGLFSAAEVGASHRRERCFVLGYTAGARLQKWERGSSGEIRDDCGMPEPERRGVEHSNRERYASTGGNGDGKQIKLPWPFPPGPGGDWNGIAADLEPAICRVAYGIPNRVDRLRALGNAVVPLVAAYAFRTLAAAAGIKLWEISHG